jgi:hypothetical protein
MAGCLRFTRPRPLTRKCARRRDERREWLADDQSRKPERSRSQVRSTPLPRHGTLPAAALFYDVTGGGDYFAARRVFLRVVDRHRLTSRRGVPRSEARGPNPHGAHSRTNPTLPKFHPSKNTASSPPPVASSPDPAGAVPDPGSGHPHRMDKGGHNVFAWHPDIPNAVPAPVTRLPDITGSRWRGSHLDHGRGRSKAHHDPDAGNAGTGDKRQGRGAENGKNRSSAHLQVPRNLASPKPPIGRGMDRSLTAVNTFRFCAPRRPPTDGLWAQD